MSIDKVGHVKSQIAANSGRLRPKYEHDGIKICCPFHAGGNERTPSCKVRLTGDVGKAHCFACKETYSWNKLAEATNMQGFKRSDQVNDVFSFIIPEENYSERSPTLEDLEELSNVRLSDGWRGITPETLRLFQAKFPKAWAYKDDFIYFPVHNNRKYIGGVYARRIVTKEGKEAGEISYINTKGKWSKTQLFGYDIAKKRKGPLWYVEGPRDAMKIAQFGGRVVAGLGSYVGPNKIRLLEALDPEVIIIGTDPDEAGNIAREYLKKNLPMIPHVDAVFPEGKDPGNFTQKSFDKMMKRLGYADAYREAA